MSWQTADTYTVGEVLTSASMNKISSDVNSLYLVTGRLNGDGTIASGSGFSVNHSGTGIYEITVDTEFAAPPIVLATALDNEFGTQRMVGITSITASGFIVNCGTSSGARQDYASMFVAHTSI